MSDIGSGQTWITRAFDWAWDEIKKTLFVLWSMFKHGNKDVRGFLCVVALIVFAGIIISIAAKTITPFIVFFVIGVICCIIFYIANSI